MAGHRFALLGARAGRQWRLVDPGFERIDGQARRNDTFQTSRHIESTLEHLPPEPAPLPDCTPVCRAPRSQTTNPSNRVVVEIAKLPA
jgi:hypothetical protein